MDRMGTSARAVAALVVCCAGSLALAGASWAHTDPPGSSKTGVGHSFGIFSDPGCTISIVGQPILECQTIFLQATLAAQPSPPNAAFEAGQWVMTAAGMQFADLGAVACIGGTFDDPNSAANNGRGLCDGAPSSQVSACVSYTPTAADIMAGSVTFQSIYGDPNPASPDTAFSHIGASDLAGTSSALGQFVTIETCSDPGNQCLLPGTCEPGPPATCIQEPEEASTPCESDQDLCTTEHCDGAGECIVESTVQCSTGDCFTEECNPATGECDRTCVPGTPQSNPECWIQVGDFIWDDTMQVGNGMQEAGEDGLAAVDVDLLDCNTGGVVESSVTDGDGLYAFAVEGIDAECVAVTRDLQIQVDLNDLPGGYVATIQNFDGNASEGIDSDCDDAGTSDCFSDLTAGDSDQRIDCGFYNPVAVELLEFEVE